jgi:ribosomal protein L11 methyltransferase
MGLDVGVGRLSPFRNLLPRCARWEQIERMWRRIALQIDDEELAEFVSSELWSLGAKGVEQRDAATFSEFHQSSFSPAEQGVTELIAFFPPGTEELVVHPLLERWPTIRVLENALFDEAAWQVDWKQFFPPTRVSPRVTIRPSWTTELPPGPHDVVLVIDPGLAFGTGTHETTRLCIREIDDYLLGHPQASVLDVGCGTGILAMAAQCLGSRQVVGIDNDPIAVQVARENWVLNHLGTADSAPFSTTPVEQLRQRFDLVVANVLSGTLIGLRNHLLEVLEASGQLVLSGILQSEQEHFLSAFSDAHLTVVCVLVEGEWIAVRMARS